MMVYVLKAKTTFVIGTTNRLDGSCIEHIRGSLARLERGRSPTSLNEPDSCILVENRL